MKAGEFLKRERERRGISIEEVAEATKISPYFLIAIENDNPAPIPEGPFFKGFIKGYAVFLGIDPDEVLSLLEPEAGMQKRTVGQRGKNLSSEGSILVKDEAADKSQVEEEKEKEVKPIFIYKKGNERSKPISIILGERIPSIFDLRNSLVILLFLSILLIVLFGILILRLKSNPAEDITFLIW